VELPGRLLPRELLAPSRIVLVPSQWPEPFGRIAVEALANRVPVLASRAGGLGEIVGDGSMGIDDFASIDAWEDALRACIEGRRIAPEDIEAGHVRALAIMAAEPVHELARVIMSLSATSSPDWKSTSIAFVGGLDLTESNTIVNAAWAKELAARGYLVGATRKDGRALPDHVLLHDYSQDFNEFVPPAAGHYVAVRSSDFGPYPRSWADKIDAEFDQLWAYTEWIAEQAHAGGVDPALVRVVPLGVDHDLFRPDGPPSPLIPQDAFTFLFVGGAVRRKGIDTLIKAYRSVFSSADNVALVIKGHSENMFYKGRSEVEEHVADADGGDGPRIVHIDAHLSAQELAALYRSCDVGVFPYRAEGFVLPIAEAMASGTPSIVPDFGPCLDFCSTETSFLVPARRIRLPFARTLHLAAGFEIDVAAVDFCEIRADALGRVLREVFEAGRDVLEARRQAGINVVRNRLNWPSSVDRVEECLGELRETVPRRIVARRAAAARAYRRDTALREMAIERALARLPKRTLV
jgi:glycosyltransferase involved in cell wall biosynthesis